MNPWSFTIPMCFFPSKIYFIVLRTTWEINSRHVTVIGNRIILKFVKVVDFLTISNPINCSLVFKWMLIGLISGLYLIISFQHNISITILSFSLSFLFDVHLEVKSSSQNKLRTNFSCKTELIAGISISKTNFLWNCALYNMSTRIGKDI